MLRERGRPAASGRVHHDAAVSRTLEPSASNKALRLPALPVSLRVLLLLQGLVHLPSHPAFPVLPCSSNQLAAIHWMLSAEVGQAMHGAGTPDGRMAVEFAQLVLSRLEQAAGAPSEPTCVVRVGSTNVRGVPQPARRATSRPPPRLPPSGSSPVAISTRMARMREVSSTLPTAPGSAARSPRW